MASTNAILKPTMAFTYEPKSGPIQAVDTNITADRFIKVSAGTLAGPLIWSGADFKDDHLYTLRLSHEDVLEIDNALAEFKSQNPKQVISNTNVEG